MRVGVIGAFYAATQVTNDEQLKLLLCRLLAFIGCRGAVLCWNIAVSPACREKDGFLVQFFTANVIHARLKVLCKGIVNVTQRIP